MAHQRQWLARARVRAAEQHSLAPLELSQAEHAALADQPAAVATAAAATAATAAAAAVAAASVGATAAAAAAAADERIVLHLREPSLPRGGLWRMVSDCDGDGLQLRLPLRLLWREGGRAWLSHAASRLVPRSSSWRKPSGQSRGTWTPAGSVSRYGPINSAVLPAGTPCRKSARSAANSVEAARVSLPPRRAARASTRATADGSRSWQRRRAASAEHGHQTRFGMDSATSPGSRRVAAVRPAPTLAPNGWTDTRERSTPREASHGETQRPLSSAWLIRSYTPANSNSSQHDALKHTTNQQLSIHCTHKVFGSRSASSWTTEDAGRGACAEAGCRPERNSWFSRPRRGS